MKINCLRLLSFRNYRELDMQPSDGLNVLIGPNGHGKTNLLESLFVLASARGLRTSRDQEMITHGEPQTRISAHVQDSSELTQELNVAIHRGSRRKQLSVDGKDRPTAEYLGRLRVVSFTVHDLETVRGEPGYRRRFMDTSICMFSPRYARHLSAYRHALEQRNHLLRQVREAGGRASEAQLSLLDVLDEQLATSGAEVCRGRAWFIDHLSAPACQAMQELTDGQETLQIRYQPALEGELHTDLTAIRTTLLSGWQDRRQQECQRGATLSGPHLDDIALDLDGMNSRLYASQGQQRSISLSLKRGEYELLRQANDEPPVVLLDDVLSDLDSIRRTRLLEMNLSQVQAFLTCTSAEALPPKMMREATVWRVHNGAMELESHVRH